MIKEKNDKNISIFSKFPDDNGQTQGVLGLAIAISWFSANGYFVSLPIADVKPYDLIVEKNNRLYKIQVKTTRYRQKTKAGGLEKSFRFNTKSYKEKDFHYYFIVTSDNNKYFIPKKKFTSMAHRFKLSSRYDKYIVD
jgi:hypothetical protein